MKDVFYFYLLILILSLSYLHSFGIKKIKNISDSDDSDFDKITDFLENTSVSTVTSQSMELFQKRFTKMRKKKEIVIKRVYEIFPLVGELLALSNVDKINLIVNKIFILRESDLLRIYITMLDGNANSIQNSSKILLNLILCNNKFNRLRCILNLLMEGLCQADDRSIEIFKEIVVTVILDTVLKTRFYYMNDLHSKLDLVKIFNKKFKYTPVTKIKFVDEMLLSDKLKEILTFIIMRLKTNIDVSNEYEKRLSEMTPRIANNSVGAGPIDKRKSIVPVGNSKNVASTNMKNGKNYNPEINGLVESNVKIQKPNETAGLNSNLTSPKEDTNNPFTTSKNEAQKILENMKTFSHKEFDTTRFKERLLNENENLERNFNYEDTKVIHPEHLDLMPNLKLKLNEIKEEIRNEYSDFLYKQSIETMPMLEEFENISQVGVNLRSIYPKYRKHLSNLIRLNELLDEFGPYTPNGTVDVSTPRKTKVETRTLITKQVSPGVNLSIQFKEKNVKDKDKETENTSEENFRFKSESNTSNQNRLETENKSQATTPNTDFATRSLRLLTDTNGGNYNKPNPISIETQDINSDSPENNNNYNAQSQEISEKITDQNLNDYGAKNNYNSISKNNFNHDELLRPLINKNKNIKVLFPKEIHTEYQVNRIGNRSILINSDSKINLFY